MKKLLGLLMICCLCLTGLAGCASWTNAHEGQWKGKTFALQHHYVTPGLFASHGGRNEWRIIYGNHAPVYMDLNTDQGPPYSTDVYGASAFIVKDASLRYDDPPEKQAVWRSREVPYASMIYIPFKDADDKAGHAYFELLDQNWPLFEQWFQAHRMRMLGIVQGSRDSFTQVFRGTMNGKKVKLVVTPDGRVTYSTDDTANPYAANHDVYSGLSGKVRMPGKVLYLKGDGDLTRANIQTLKNARGSDPTHYFDIRPAP